MIPITSIAGRHAADRERSRAAVAAFDVRQDLEHALRSLDIPKVTGDYRGTSEPAIAVVIGFDRVDQDAQVRRLFVHMGWRAHPWKLSRFSPALDTIQLIHEDHGVPVTLIVQRVTNEALASEAA